MRTAIFLFFVIVTATNSIANETSTEALILEDIAIVDVETGKIVKPRSILLEHGRVVEVADSPSPDWPGAQRPDVAGLFLSPALYDAHVHLFDERDLQMYALSGIQAVRNMDGWPWHLSVRDQNSESESPRARFITVGSQLQLPDIETADDALERISQERNTGYDWVKLYDDLPSAALAGLATQRDYFVTGHLPSNVPVPEVLQFGVLDDIAHAEELTHALGGDYPEGEPGLDALAQDMLESGTALTTTLVNNRMIADQLADFEANLNRPEVAYAPPLLQAFWRSPINPWSAPHDAESVARVDRQVHSLMSLTAGLHKRGVALLAGSDAPNPTTVPAYSLYQELSLLVEAGLTPAQALQTATISAADRLEPGQHMARIEAGASANFILSRKNPLEDIAVLQEFEALVIDGNWFTRQQTDDQREQLRIAYERDLEVLSGFAPDSPAGVFEAIEASSNKPAISAEGLTSLVWFYMKIGNLEAASTVAERLVQMYPSPGSQAISTYIDGRIGD